jgi:aryl-alcohol dehydrogenase-like predicted oxidoreductase
MTFGQRPLDRVLSQRFSLENTKLLTAFGDIAKSLGLTMAQLSLAWLLAYPKAV